MYHSSNIWCFVNLGQLFLTGHFRLCRSHAHITAIRHMTALHDYIDWYRCVSLHWKWSVALNVADVSNFRIIGSQKIRGKKKQNLETKRQHRKYKTKNKNEHRWCLAKLRTAEQQFKMAWEPKGIPECFVPTLQQYYVSDIIWYKVSKWYSSGNTWTWLSDRLHLGRSWVRFSVQSHIILFLLKEKV